MSEPRALSVEFGPHIGSPAVRDKIAVMKTIRQFHDVRLRELKELADNIAAGVHTIVSCDLHAASNPQTVRELAAELAQLGLPCRVNYEGAAGQTALSAAWSWSNGYQAWVRDVDTAMNPHTEDSPESVAWEEGYSQARVDTRKHFARLHRTVKPVEEPKPPVRLARVVTVDFYDVADHEELHDVLCGKLNNSEAEDMRTHIVGVLPDNTLLVYVDFDDTERALGEELPGFAEAPVGLTNREAVTWWREENTPAPRQDKEG